MQQQEHDELVIWLDVLAPAYQKDLEQLQVDRLPPVFQNQALHSS